MIVVVLALLVAFCFFMFPGTCMYYDLTISRTSVKCLHVWFVSRILVTRNQLRFRNFCHYCQPILPFGVVHLTSRFVCSSDCGEQALPSNGAYHEEGHQDTNWTCPSRGYGGDSGRSAGLNRRRRNAEGPVCVHGRRRLDVRRQRYVRVLDGRQYKWGLGGRETRAELCEVRGVHDRRQTGEEMEAILGCHKLNGRVTEGVTDCEPSMVTASRRLTKKKVLTHIGCISHRVVHHVAILRRSG